MKKTRYNYHPFRIITQMGELQWIYEGKKGVISLITLPDYIDKGVTLWEARKLKGEEFWFDGSIERFDSQADAEDTIKELMGEDIEGETIKNDFYIECSG